MQNKIRIVRLLVFYFILFEFISCVNQSNEVSKNKTYRTQKKGIRDSSKYENIIKVEDFNNSVNYDTIVLNLELSIKFDSMLNLFDEYNQKQPELDSLMVFKKEGQDTLINKSEVQFIEAIDPWIAYYLFGIDTIIGGNGYCDSDYYLFNKGKLFKIINQFADCVESSSSTRKEISFDAEGMIKWFYLKDIEDVWDETKFQQGLEGNQIEIIAYYELNRFQFGIRKVFIDCRSDMNLADTLKYERIKYEDINYLVPQIRFGFKN